MAFSTYQDIRQAAGQLLVCGFETQSITPQLKEIFREVQPLGVILFARNIDSPQQVAQLNQELKCYRAPHPLMVSVDQEGGRVQRIGPPASVWPPMGQLGSLDDPDLVRRVGRALGRELRAMNFDIDFAPVLDVHTYPDNPVIGLRAFSSSPEKVAQMGVSLFLGLEEMGVASCVKHFPGHGDTSVDSHVDLPYVTHDLKRLQSIEWRPFQAAIEAGVGAIMTAHVVVEALDKMPATLSKVLLKDCLRTYLNFKGVIVSDAIDMKALSDRYAPCDIARYGLQAGVDLFLACREEDVIDTYRGIITAVEKRIIPESCLFEAAQRVQKWRNRFCQPPVDASVYTETLGNPQHRQLVQEIQERLQQRA